MKVLHIHIGTPKTATTAIQRFLYNNSEVLEKKGYCYPVFPYKYPVVSKLRAHFLLGMIKNEDGERNTAQEQKNFEDGMKMVKEAFSTCDHVILSDERIWRGMAKEKKDLWDVMQKEADQGGFALHVVVYLRRQDKYFVSLWNQVVKHLRSQETFEHFVNRVDKNQLDYYGKLEQMADIIGKENITVRCFDSGRFEGGSIYSDFLRTIGLSLTEEYEIPEEKQNTGLYGNTHEIKRVINALPQTQDAEAQGFIKDTLQNCSGVSKEIYPAEMYSKEEMEKFLEPYKEGNRKIAEEYLHETAGTDLFDYTIKDLPKWQKENPYMMDDLIRFTGAMGMSLYQENQRLKKELEELSHEFSSLRFHLRHPLKTVIRKIKGKTSSK